VEGVLVRVLAVPAAGAIRVGADHAVEGEDMRVSQGFDGLGIVTDRGRILSDLGLRKHDADLHGCARRLRGAGRRYTTGERLG
jgi:hypothetical protein